MASSLQNFQANAFEKSQHISKLFIVPQRLTVTTPTRVQKPINIMPTGEKGNCLRPDCRKGVCGVIGCFLKLEEHTSTVLTSHLRIAQEDNHIPHAYGVGILPYTPCIHLRRMPDGFFSCAIVGCAVECGSKSWFEGHCRQHKLPDFFKKATAYDPPFSRSEGKLDPQSGDKELIQFAKTEPPPYTTQPSEAIETTALTPQSAPENKMKASMTVQDMRVGVRTKFQQQVYHEFMRSLENPECDFDASYRRIEAMTMYFKKSLVILDTFS
ncbi:hypothetical protein BJ508DRAFT_328221 [Ascobolus immersus RN42]|uniref:Uncharacterized protein n=1 Tax=Ascobolus immersus RN42 TaxID=1160509 RepID=A0A3N4I0K5_ASCIM|nr:hypothetical protein BJ508DRAFT_328221 [Ascobolus immersus RN42]